MLRLGRVGKNSPQLTAQALQSCDFEPTCSCDDTLDSPHAIICGVQQEQQDERPPLKGCVIYSLSTIRSCQAWADSP